VRDHPWRVALNCARAYHAAMTCSAYRLTYLVPFIGLLAGACIEETRRIADSDTTPDATDPSVDADSSDTSPGEPCDEPGITRCAADAAATEVCLNGTWQRAACVDGKICVLAGGAQCVDSTGDAECRDTFYCFLGCQFTHPDDPAAAERCLVECFRGATPAAQRELSDVSSCFEENCADEAGLECVAERCSQDLADCYFDTKGDASCGSIIECRVGCSDDTACAQACGSDATIAAQGRYAVLELCIYYACYGQEAECARRASLPTGGCSAYTNACIGLLPNTPR